MDSFILPGSFFALHAYLLVTSVTMALLEVNIEGKNGWAGKLPTWRWTPTWYRKFGNGKEITGYHTYLLCTLLLLFHLPALFTGWSWQFEWTILAVYLSFSLLWDFLWFVFNPGFGFAGFRKGNVWWYTKWIGRMPIEYVVSTVIGFAFAAFSGMTAGALGDPRLAPLPVWLQHSGAWLISFFLAALCTAALAAVHHPKKNKLPLLVAIFARR